MMETFLDQMEAAVTKRCAAEKKQLQKQLDKRQISQKTFQLKAKEIEKWVTAEKRDIKAKRAKVQDTCGDLNTMLKRIQHDKLILEGAVHSATSTPRRSSRISDS